LTKSMSTVYTHVYILNLVSPDGSNPWRYYTRPGANLARKSYLKYNKIAFEWIRLSNQSITINRRKTSHKN